MNFRNIGHKCYFKIPRKCTSIKKLESKGKLKIIRLWFLKWEEAKCFDHDDDDCKRCQVKNGFVEIKVSSSKFEENFETKKKSTYNQLVDGVILLHSSITRGNKLFRIRKDGRVNVQHTFIPSKFSTKSLYIFLISYMCVFCPTNLLLADFLSYKNKVGL
jgi:hypothetical protein